MADSCLWCHKPSSKKSPTMYEERFCYRVHSKRTGLMGKKFGGDLKCLLKTMVMDLNACQRQTAKKEKFILRIEYPEIDVGLSHHINFFLKFTAECSIGIK